MRVGERTNAVFGTSAVCLSMVVFAMTGHGTGVALVEVALVLSGIGMGVASPSLAATVANAADQDSLGTASATQQLMTQIAAIAGIQVMQTVQASGVQAGGATLLGSFHTAYLVGGAVAVLGVLCASALRSVDRGRVGAASRRTIGADGMPAISGAAGMGEVLVPDEA
jgi:hypothetical protein